MCRLLDCLTDVALEYARKVNTDDDYKSLRRALRQRFSKKDDPFLIKKQSVHGSRSPNFAHRQVSFAENVKGEEKSPTKNNLPLEKEGRELTQVVTTLADIMISSQN